MFPALSALLADLALPGDWPAVLRGYAMSAGEAEACDLARLVGRWAVAWAAGRERDRLRGGWACGHPGGAVAAVAPPPTGGGYWWLGATRAGRPVMGWCPVGGGRPAGVSLWTTEGLGHWCRVPAGG